MKKGITAVTAAIMVVVIITLLGTVTVTSYNSIQNAKKLTFALEISNIKEEVDSYIKNAIDDDYPISDNTYTINLSNITANSVSQFNGETKNANNEITLYEVDLQAIGIEDTEYGNKETEKDVYVLSKETRRVYYLEGVKFKDKTYYTLTQDLIDIKERNQKENEEESSLGNITISTDGIIKKTTSDGDVERYVSNIKVTGKGIKFVKYELGKIPEDDVTKYFKSNGKKLLGDRIDAKDNDVITIYVEDKDGNYKVIYIDDENKPQPPVLVAGNRWISNWWTNEGQYYCSYIDKINIVDRVDDATASSATLTWGASDPYDVNNLTGVACYLNGTTLTIAGNGAGSIKASSDLSYAFSRNMPTSTDNNPFYLGSTLTINGLDLLDVSDVTNMSNMFDGTILNGMDLYNWDVRNVTDMSDMFYNAELLNVGDGLNNVGFSNWKTDSVINMQNMFYQATFPVPTDLDLTNWTVNNVTDMFNMFANTNLFGINLSSWNTENVTSINGMFSNCTNLYSLDVRLFNTSKIEMLKGMFSNCPGLTHLYLGENFGQAGNIPGGGYYNNLLYVSTPNDYLTIHGANSLIKNYNFAADNRTVTFE